MLQVLGPIVVFVNHMNFGLHGMVPGVDGRLVGTYAGSKSCPSFSTCAAKLLGLTGWLEYANSAVGCLFCACATTSF